MPPKQAFSRQSPVILAPSVKHHFDGAFNVPVRGLPGADIHAETPRDVGTYLSRVEPLSFNFTALLNVVGERFRCGLLLEVEAQLFHVPDGAALAVTHGGEGTGDCFGASAEPRPVLQFVDIHTQHQSRVRPHLSAFYERAAACLRPWQRRAA